MSNTTNLQLEDRVRTPKGVGTINAISNDMIIVKLDRDHGIYYFNKEDCSKVDNNMAKDRMAVVCNGRPAFYACMWEDIRQCAMNNGWAVALHGSLSSDMDIMAMPWIDECVSFEDLIYQISLLFYGNQLAESYTITYNEKPHNRVVATIPIFADFYLDISTIKNGE